MGFHEANPSVPSDYTWWDDSGAEARDLQVFLVRDSRDSKNAKFVLKNETQTIYQESDYIYDIYENEHYNVAIRIKPETYPYAGGVTNTTPNYEIELYAVTNNFGDIETEVLLSQTVAFATGSAYIRAPKRIYAGAHLENFTGTVQEYSDVQIGGVRAWFDYLDNDEIFQHNKDVLNYGTKKSIDGSNLYTIEDVQIPSQELTILNWDFDTVTTSDPSGEFEVEDITSGSTDTVYGWIDQIIKREHKAKGAGFAFNASNVFSYEFIQAYKKQLPEVAYDAENIYIKGEQEINFSNDDDVSDNLFVMEKSPASLISEEMMKSFSSTLEFANLFGRSVERYRVEYKDLARARQLFFDKVESNMDFDKFFEYFKWIDSSISSMVNQLIPASANFAGGIVDVIEPHILERDKYQRQIGLLSTITSTEASIRGVQELKYNWKTGHAPLSGLESDNCLWHAERRERDTNETEIIRQISIRQTDQEYVNSINLSGSTGLLSGSTYATRRLSRPYTLEASFSNSIHGGINYDKTKDRDFFKTVITPHGDVGTGPKNIMTIGAGDGHGLNPTGSCQDETRPNSLVKRDGTAQIGKFSSFAPSSLLDPLDDSLHYLFRRKVSHVFPGNIVSSSVDTGYSSQINRSGLNNGFKVGIDVVNLHSDTTDITNEIPIQGPFTNQWVGGQQIRHIALATDVQAREDRPEIWRLLIGTNPLQSPGDTDGAMGFTGPDYGSPYPIAGNQKAIYYREERAKRPVNIKNIQTIIGTGSHGNYQHEYEVMSTFGDQGYFLRRSDNLLPTIISDALPQTTNYFTLISQDVTTEGNIFGEPNNRQYDTSYTIPGTPLFQGNPSTGGSFIIYGLEDTVVGDYISIDGVTYEIGGTTLGGVEIVLETTNTAFYDGLETSLQNAFPAVNFTVGYTETTILVSPEITAVKALGGSFKILGFADVTSGHYITIDSTDYEIATNVQLGETLPIITTSNNDFYDSLQALLETNFPISDYTVSYTPLNNGGSLPGSAGQALTISDDDQNIGLQHLGTPSWSPPTNGATSRPITFSFYINIPTPSSSTPTRKVIYSEFWTHPTFGDQTTAKSFIQFDWNGQTSSWDLGFYIGYQNNGGGIESLGHIYNDFIGTYGGQLTHVLITTEGTMDEDDPQNNISGTETKLCINGEFKEWDTLFNTSANGGTDYEPYISQII